MSLGAALERGLAELGMELDAPARGRLLEYLGLIEKWNRTHNLTAIRDPAAMVGQHLLDSLAVLPHLGGTSLADIGSGAGLPGIPIAIARPSWRIALVESNQKKASFLRQARIELGLDNVEIVAQRVEAWMPPTLLDCAISRAFSDLSEFLRLAKHLVGPDGTLAAMKGIYPDEELAQIPPGFALRRAVELRVPGVAGARHLMLIGFAP